MARARRETLQSPKRPDQAVAEAHGPMSQYFKNLAALREKTVRRVDLADLRSTLQ
jgi:hypothetical protein